MWIFKSRQKSSKGDSQRGYPKSLTRQAYNRDGQLTQEQCLGNSKKDSFPASPQKRTNFITTYQAWRNRKPSEVLVPPQKRSGPKIYIRPKNPTITYKRPPTLENILAPSRLRKHTPKIRTTLKPGVYKCNRPPLCMCCQEIQDGTK